MTTALQPIILRDCKILPVAASGRYCRLRMIEGRTTKVNWAELIRKVASHQDREAFKVLFEHFAPRIKGFLVKTGCAPQEAEEIAQSALITVWRKASQFDPATTGAAAWIFTIARNLRIDRLRRVGVEG